jgi:hypothetical protein
MDQFEMRFEPAKPEVNEWEVKLMCLSLQHDGGWMTAADIIAKHSMANTEQSRRVLRALAESSNGEIISGQLGYKHNSFATEEERARCVHSLESQARKMNERAARIKVWPRQMAMAS